MSAKPMKALSGDRPVHRCYIGGRWVDATETFSKVSPINGAVIANVAEAGVAMVDAAVAAARVALRGPWGSMLVSERRRILYAIADGIEARFDEFVAAEVLDTGRPTAQARTLDIPRGAANFRLFADLIGQDAGESFFTETPDNQGALNYTVRKPHGVVAVVSPWNLPFLLLTWKVAPAMALGNAVVAKPSEETPATATLLAEVIDAAGVPAGAFNLVHGHGPDAAGQFLTTHPGIDAITFTGETGTGSTIMRAAAAGVKPVSFELGGKNAAVVFADADLSKAIEGVARSSFFNCGQVCLCTERVYVERPVFDRFVAGLKDKAKELRPALPDDPSCTIGPLISHQHREKVLGYYALARREGATIVTGGGVPHLGGALDAGCWIEPTILTGLSQSARCVQEEIFGPVTHVAPFDTEEEAIALANDTHYGLAAAIWTDNLARGHRVARQMEVGIAWVNAWFLRDLRTPFGGVRLSGLGREGGAHSLAFYGEPMNICVKL